MICLWTQGAAFFSARQHRAAGTLQGGMRRPRVTRAEDKKQRRAAAGASGMPCAPIERRASAMNEKKNQCIHCSVESCRHLKSEQGICSLESIQVAPTPMAYSGDPADESMCQSYHCK